MSKTSFTNSSHKKLVIVLETKNWQEKKEHRLLCHDGGKLLTFLIRRLSIKREDWVHTYLFDGNKGDIPTILWERRDYLFPYVDNVLEFIKLNKPCVVVGMGKLCAEVLVRGSILSKRAGTFWEPAKIAYKKRYGLRKVWISHTTDAALYNPELAVGITRIIWRAATEANIPTKIDYTLIFPDFWYNYQ